MKNRKQIIVPLVLMIVTGIFTFTRLELSELIKVDTLLILVFGVFFGILLTTLRYKKQ